MSKLIPIDKVGPQAISSSVQYAESILGPTNGMLREIAKVESNDGEHPNTFSGVSNGIWQVDNIGLQATKDTKSHGGLVDAHNKIKESTGLNWEDIKPEDLNNPTIGALAARLYLMTIPEEIPEEPEAKAQYWKKYYNTIAGKGTPEDYLERIKPLIGFDPEGSGYDEIFAAEKGIEPDEDGHYPSLAPLTNEEAAQLGLPEGSGRLLKGRQHETFDKEIEASNELGRSVVKLGDNYYSVPRSLEPVEEETGAPFAWEDIKNNIPPEYHRKVKNALSIASTYDISPQEAYKLVDKFEEIYGEKNIYERAISNFKAGVGSTYVLAANAGEMVGLPGTHMYKSFGENLRKAYIPPTVEVPFSAKQFSNPEWWATNVMSTVPTTLSLIPAAVLAAYGGGSAAAAYGFGSFGTTVFATLSATIASRPLEAALEAGGAREEALSLNKSVEEADAIGERVFWRNVKMAGIDFTELMLSFSPIKLPGKSAQAALIKRVLTSVFRVGGTALIEGAEERWQEIIQLEEQHGKDVSFFADDPRLNEATAIGSIFGAGMGSTGVVWESLVGSIEETMPDPLAIKYAQWKEVIGKEGLPPMQAQIKLLDILADDPEGKAHIESVMEYLKNPPEEGAEVHVAGIIEDKEGNPVAYTYLDRATGQTFDVSIPATAEKVAAAREGLEPTQEVDINRIIEAGEDESEILVNRVLIHGTTKEAATRIRESGKFTLEGSDRQYDYSELGPGAIYVAETGTFWFDTQADGRKLIYEEKLEVSLDKDTKLYVVNSQQDIVNLAKQIGMPVGEMTSKLTADNLKVPPEQQDARLKREFQESLEVQKKIEALGYDGIDIRSKNAMDIAWSGPQIAIWNTDKIKLKTEEDVSFAKGTASGAMSVEELQVKSNEVTRGWTKHPIATTFNKLPNNIKKRIIASRGEGVVKAVFDPLDKQVYFIADMIAPGDNLKELALHEIVGHYGVEEVLRQGEFTWEEIAGEIKRLKDSGNKEILKAFTAVNSMYSAGELTPILEAKEIIAHMAQKGVKNSLIRKIIAAIKRGIRKLTGGRFGKITDLDIKNLITQAQEMIEGSRILKDSFNQGGPALEARQSPLWYSRLANLVLEQNVNKQPAAQWLKTFDSWARKGKIPPALQEEIAWNGLVEYLKMRGSDKVTKAEILEAIESGGVKVTEEVLGQVGTLQEEVEKLIDRNITVKEEWENLDIDYKDESTKPSFDAPYDEKLMWFVETFTMEAIESAAEDFMQDPEAISSPVEYERNTLIGGKNYRELLVTLPQQAPPSREEIKAGVLADWVDEYEAYSYTEDYFPEAPRFDSSTREERLAFIEKNLQKEIEQEIDARLDPKRQGEYSESKLKGFTSIHFSQRPNILVWIRFDERTVDGKRVLFINEIQSDWAKSGRQLGFVGQFKGLEEGERVATPEEDPIVTEAVELAYQPLENITREEADAKLDKLHEQLVAMGLHVEHGPSGPMIIDPDLDVVVQPRNVYREGTVPDAPFVKSDTAWSMLGLKRAIKYAVDNGFDKVAWPAEAQTIYDIEEWGQVARGEGFVVEENIYGQMTGVNQFPTLDAAQKFVEEQIDLMTGWVFEAQIGDGVWEILDKHAEPLISKRDAKQQLKEKAEDWSVDPSTLRIKEIKKEDVNDQFKIVDARGMFRLEEETDAGWEVFKRFKTRAEAEAHIKELREEHDYEGGLRIIEPNYTAGGQDVSAIVMRYLKDLPRNANRFLKSQMGNKVKVQPGKIGVGQDVAVTVIEAMNEFRNNGVLYVDDKVYHQSSTSEVEMRDILQGYSSEEVNKLRREIVAYMSRMHEVPTHMKDQLIHVHPVSLANLLNDIQAKYTKDFSTERAQLEEFIDKVNLLTVEKPEVTIVKDTATNEIDLQPIKDKVSEEGVPLFAKKSDTKKRIRQITGQRKDPGADVTEREALKQGFRKAARDARRAYAQGKKDELVKQKEKLAESIAKIKAREEAKTAKVKTAKEILKRRRNMIKDIKAYFNLTDAELRKISKKDIRLMSNWEFKKFKDDLYLKATQLAEKSLAKATLMQTIFENRLEKVENYRLALGLPPISKMSQAQLEEFNDTLLAFEPDDQFLTRREIEVIDNTELQGMRTWREVREAMADRSGVSVEDLSNLNLSELDKFRWDSSLMERSPFYWLLVTRVNQSMLAAQQRTHDIETETYRLARASQASRGLTFVEKAIPQDEQILEYLEASEEHKLQLAELMTPEQLDFAHFVQEYFGQALEYLIELGALDAGKENYFVHIRRSLLETVKEDGIFAAVKELFTRYEQDQIQFGILDNDLENILPLEKFFRYSLQRTGELAPTKNITRAFLTYVTALEKKKALDAIVPEMYMYAQALTPKNYTPRGLQVDRRLEKFVKQYLNNKKGRRLSYDGVLRQGGKLDLIVASMRTFTTLMDLGLNIPVGIASFIGEQVATYTMLGSKKHALGTKRLATAKGRAIVHKYEAFTGRSLWEEWHAPGKELTGKLHEGLFALFHQSSRVANKQFLLGNMTDEEWANGELSDEKLATLKLEMGRFRKIPGIESLVGSTSAGKASVQYKAWAIPIVRTLIKDLTTMAKDLKSKPMGDALTSKEAKELFRAINITTLVLIIGSFASIDKKDKSFLGQLKAKMYREALTLLQAVDVKLLAAIPRTAMFVAQLANNMSAWLLLEEYKNKPLKGKLKGPRKLRQQFTPRLFKQFTDTSGKKAQPLKQ